MSKSSRKRSGLDADAISCDADSRSAPSSGLGSRANLAVDLVVKLAVKLSAELADALAGTLADALVAGLVGAGVAATRWPMATLSAPQSSRVSQSAAVGGAALSSALSLCTAISLLRGPLTPPSWTVSPSGRSADSRGTAKKRAVSAGARTAIAAATWQHAARRCGASTVPARRSEAPGADGSGSGTATSPSSGCNKSRTCDVR
eukprot:4859380-Pleurochrysis_carterae.AAC.1